MTEQPTRNIAPNALFAGIRDYLLPFFSTIVFGLIAHAFMLTNKICFAGDAGGGDTIVSGRFGLALTSYIMPDISMPWLNGMLSVVTQTEGFEEGVKLAIVGEEPALRYDLQSHFDLSGFQDPDIDIKNRIHAEGIINSFCGCSIPFASEEELSALSESEDVAAMAVYPYYGSVKRIGDCIVVRLGE